jgi:tripeptidyl-peptidase I
MAFLNILSLLLALSTSTFASPASEMASKRGGSYKNSISEKLNGPPFGWKKDEAVNIDKDEAMIKLRIHHPQQDMGKFHDPAIKVHLRRRLVDFWSCLSS